MTEGHLRRLIDCVVDAIVVLNGELEVTFSNAAARAIVTGDAEMAISGNGTILVHPEDVNTVFEAMAALQERPGGRVSITFRLQLGTEVLPVEAFATNLLDDPVVAGIVVCFRDLSGEVATQRRANLLHSAIEATTDLMVIVDRDLRVVHANRAATLLLGLDGPDASLADVRPASTRLLLEQVALPMAERVGVWSGEGQLANANGRHLLDASLVVTAQLAPDGSVDAYSLLARDITERKLIEGALRRQARLDALTNLLNRNGLMDELERCLVAESALAGGSVAVLFIDLDNFKIANDSLGHVHGDELLRQVARRLVLITQRSIVARYGGDEFVAVLPHVDNIEQATAVADRICAGFHDAVVVDGFPVHLSCSIGIAVSRPGEAADHLLRSADLAMYQAKELGRNRWECYRPSMHDAANRSLQLHSELRRALLADELIVHYQPIIGLPERRLTGFEALVRWDHPSGRRFQPVDFLDVATHAQLMADIDEHVLTTACAQVARWQELHPLAPKMTMAVNVSPAQLARTDLVSLVSRVVDANRLELGQLHLELTEQQLLGELHGAGRTIDQVRQLGVRVAIDDFGTDHSSLSYLSALEVDSLKIDRNFLTSHTSWSGRIVVRAIAGLAHELGLRTVAEGVETAGQLDLIENVGVDAAQGFFFGEAMPGDDAAELVGALSV